MSDPSSSPALPRMRSTTSGASGCKRGVVAGDTPGEGRELTKIGQPDRPARPGEQPDERGSRARVAEHPQGADDIDHLGRGEQAAQTQDAMRDAAAAERVAEPTMCFLLRNRIAPVVERARGAALAADPSEPRRHPIRLGIEIGVEGELDLAGGRSGTRAQFVDGDRRGGGQRREHGVGGGEHARAVAPAGGERELAHGASGAKDPANPPRLPALAPRQP